MHVRGVTFKVHWTLWRLTVPAAPSGRAAAPAHSTRRIRYELSGDDDGRTTFQYTNEFHPPGGRLGNVASRMIVGATSEREAKNSLERLKALLERD